MRRLRQALKRFFTNRLLAGQSAKPALLAAKRAGGLSHVLLEAGGTGGRADIVGADGDLGVGRGGQKSGGGRKRYDLDHWAFPACWSGYLYWLPLCPMMLKLK